MSKDQKSTDTSEKSSSQDNTDNTKKRSNTGKIIIFAFLIGFIVILCTAAGAGATWYYMQQSEETEESSEDNDNGGENEDENDDQGDDEEEEVEMTTLDGEYITGEYPEDWTVIEYVDGDYADMLVDLTDYIGVTGIEVKKPNGQTVFNLKAVHGIGGMGGCDNYYEFSDSSQAYYNEMLNESQAVGINMTTVDLTGSNYSEFTFFGTPVRRIGMDMYYDTDTTNNSFDAGCGINAQFWWLDGLQYDAAGMSTSGYEVELTGNLTDAEFSTLEDILESLTVI